tara:strand:- start:1578 stop:2111 length:534 start_codon:yes stop_codon:yes gene_type:complete
MSTLKVNSIIPVAGVPTGGGGGIIQVLQGVHTSAISIANDSFTSVGPTVNITPTSSSSKILARLYVTGAIQNNNEAAYFRLSRDGNSISGSLGDSDGSRTQASTAIHSYTSGSLVFQTCSFEFLDSPSTTSQVSYRIQVRRSSSGAGIVYLGRNDTDSNDASTARFPTVLTVMEVSA